MSRLASVTFKMASKRFRLVSEQKKTVERDFRFWLQEKWNENQKMREGGGGGGGEEVMYGTWHAS